MKKMPTLFNRQFENHRVIKALPEVNAKCEWVVNGEGVATRKWDGTCTLIQDGKVFRRYDCKRGKTPPTGFIPADEPDPITGHWPGWVELDLEGPKGDTKFWAEAINNSFEGDLKNAPNGTYELCGPKINGNHEHLDKHILIKHGADILEDVPRDYDGIREYLESHMIEGIVFHRNDGSQDMCKIKRSDFGFDWGK